MAPRGSRDRVTPGSAIAAVAKATANAPSIPLVQEGDSPRAVKDKPVGVRRGASLSSALRLCRQGPPTPDVLDSPPPFNCFPFR